MFGRGSTSSASSAKASAPGKKKGFDSTAVNDIFISFADPEDPDILDSDCIQKLWESIEVDPMDVRTLVALWKLGAVSKPGAITREEFLRGMEELQLSSLVALKSVMPQFDPGFLETKPFRDFYRFAFNFSREGTNKTIEKELVQGLLELVLDVHRAPHLPQFLEFLAHETSAKHTRISFDQWDSFLQFQSVPVDLVGYDYDGSGAWPVIFDDYVEWRLSSSSKK